MNEPILREFQPGPKRITSELKITNDGPDDKYAIALHFVNIQGQYKQYSVTNELKRGATINISLKELGESIREFSISWEDACARIRRFTQDAKSQSPQGYIKMKVWWVTIYGNQEEQLVSGDA